MEREEITSALVQSMAVRNAECDSLISLKIREAQCWCSKLVETDILLEESVLLRIEEKQKAGRKTKIWFGLGSVVGLFIGMVL